MSKAEEVLEEILHQIPKSELIGLDKELAQVKQALSEREQHKDYIKELEEDRQSVFEEMAKRGKEIKQLREAAEQIVVHFNLGTLKGQPKALVACGDLSALLDTIKEAGE